MKPNTDAIKEVTINRPTAADVAKEAGVSRTQVSYVLNNNRLAHVSQENRAKILKAAETLGYQPLSSAQSLRRGYSKEFSIFFPAPYPPRINRIIGTIHEIGLINGFSPIQYSFNSYKDKKRMSESLNTMLNKKPYGIFCSLMDINRKEIDYMLEKGVKKVLIWDIEKHEDLPTIYLPIREVGQITAKYFASKNYNHVGLIQPSDPIQKRANELRLLGFKESWDSNKKIKLDILKWPEGVYRPTLDSAEQLIDELVKSKSLPRAIYAYSDDYALPLIAVLNKRGIRIPDEVAVLGTDNLSYSQMISPTLSTIQFDSDEMGLRVIAMMNHLISGKPLDKMFSQPPRPILIEREST